MKNKKTQADAVRGLIEAGLEAETGDDRPADAHAEIVTRLGWAMFALSVAGLALNAELAAGALAVVAMVLLTAPAFLSMEWSP